MEADPVASWGMIAQVLSTWQVDPLLAEIRDEPALSKLHEPERAPLRALWADIEALRRKAATPAGK